MTGKHIFRFYILTGARDEPKMPANLRRKRNSRYRNQKKVWNEFEIREVMGSREGRFLKRVFFRIWNRNEEISMKKTLVACLAVVALVAVAASAGAITCTSDQRPAATLLIPYFQATFNADGTIQGTGAAALDTLVTIGNASAAPMIAHVNVWSERSELVLDFNVALTGYDIQSWSMASVLRGNLPVTPVDNTHTPATSSKDACQRNATAAVYPNPGGYLRVRPTAPATGLDNTLATTVYPAGPFATSFLFGVLDSLDDTADSRACGGVDNTIANPIRGYVTIDHANYCNLSNPSDPAYYTNDAIGMENNLWGDYIFTNSAGLGTEGYTAVDLEADFSLADGAAPPTATSHRTFYRRYVTVPDGAACLNVFPTPQVAWSCIPGDAREPLGLKYAARWFDSAPTVTSFFNVWRASSGSLTDLLDGGSCDTVEPTVALTFYDEDENIVSQGVCPSPCVNPTFNFPFETQRSSITAFSHPAWPAGWVNMGFFNGSAPNAGALDQAYVTYDIQGATLFLSAGVPGTQLDPSTCNPLGVVGPPVVTPVIPTVPTGTGS